MSIVILPKDGLKISQGGGWQFAFNFFNGLPWDPANLPTPANLTGQHWSMELTQVGNTTNVINASTYGTVNGAGAGTVLVVVPPSVSGAWPQDSYDVVARLNPGGNLPDLVTILSAPPDARITVVE